VELCVFQGTFNPIHNAHLRAADYVVKNCGIDKVIFIPAFNPPHKFCSIEYSKYRYKMVELAIADNPHFLISDIEYKRQGKSYTYLTICELYEIYKPKSRIKFLIGTDAFKKIESWYEFNKLKDLIEFIVFIREDNFDISQYDYLKKLGVIFEFQTLPYKDISSTELRKKIRDGEIISGLIPNKVEEYIKENGLYKN